MTSLGKECYVGILHYQTLDPPIAVGVDNLQQTLTAGDNAGGLNITNLNDIGLTTINGGAYPPPASLSVVDTNIDTTYYPTFVDVTGPGVTLRADATTLPFSVNPNTGNFNVADTLKLDQDKVALGKEAGSVTQGTNSVAIGRGAGKTNQGNTSVAVGAFAGITSQGAGSVGVGSNAGNSNQGTNSIAIGNSASTVSQGTESISVGLLAGQTSQGTKSVAIGSNAGKTTQARDSVAIGNSAGLTSQGEDAVAIGRLAGQTSQAPNSIALNATGVALNPATTGFFVKPIIGQPVGFGVGVLIYNPATGEIYYSTT